MKNLTSFWALSLCLGTLWGQVDDEFWFVAPEVISGHGDLPIYLRFATFDVPADVTVDMPANAAYDAFEFTIPASSAYSLDLTSLVTVHERPTLQRGVGQRGPNHQLGRLCRRMRSATSTTRTFLH